MSKSIRLVLSLALVFAMLVGLAPAQAESAKLKVVTTIFPSYDFVREIAGDKVELSLLIRPGSDYHAFEFSPQDVKTIEEADLFIYTGGENDKKFDDMLEALGDKAPTSLRLVDQVKTVGEEIKEGMTHEHDHEDHDHDHEAFTREDVEERALAEFAGEYRNLTGYILAGDFDHIAELRKKEDETAEGYKNRLVTNFGTDFEYLNIRPSGLQLLVDGQVTEEANYKADGIYFHEEDGHLDAMYQFQKEGNEGTLPKYILLADHQIKANQERGKYPHFHMNHSNESYEAAYNAEVAPFYVLVNNNKESLEAWLLGSDDSHGSGHNSEEHEDEDHEHEDEEEHEGEAHNAHDDHDHDHSHAIDEHVWTSPDNAKALVKAIAKQLSKLDPANEEFYTQNYKAYNAKLDEWEEALEAIVKGANRKVLVFGDRFPFRYLIDALELDYYAAFPGCTAEIEASAQTISFLIDKVKENQLPVILKIELTDSRIAETIAADTGTKILVLNSGHNLSAEEFAAGKTFLDLMTENLEVLKEALQ